MGTILKRSGEQVENISGESEPSMSASGKYLSSTC